MNYQIMGDALQSLLINLDLGESVFAEAGCLIFCNEAVQMIAPRGSAASDRAVASNDSALSLSCFTCVAPGGTVAFASPFAGKVHVLDVDGANWRVERRALLCLAAAPGAESAQPETVTSARAGGTSLVLHRLRGASATWLHLGGNIVESKLTEGQQLRVDPACIAAVESSVRCSMEFVGGFRNAVFGGEGIHLAVLQGPGAVILQTMPGARTAARLQHVARSTSEASPPRYTDLA